MAGINTYRDLDLDTSIVLNFPKGMLKVVSEVTALLNSKGALVVDEGDISVARARELVASATGDKTTYYMVNTVNTSVWSILREAVNRDNLRVLGIFHGMIPTQVPENVFTIDIGRSLNSKVSKAIVGNISDTLRKAHASYPQGNPEEVYLGIRSLCYEVLYDPEYRLFPKDVAAKVPLAVAFDFMYNPPQPLDNLTMRSAVSLFLDSVHGLVG